MTGYVTFRIADRQLACELSGVREVVRLAELDILPGMEAPVSGLIELRGTPLPVVDLRTKDGGPGDVLVLAPTGRDSIGIAVDQVVAVRGDGELTTKQADPATGLPAYVVDLLHDVRNEATVLLVDVWAMAGLAPTGR